MDIAFAYDDAYAAPARAALESVLQAHADVAVPDIWILAPPDVLRRDGSALQRQAAGRARIHLLAADDRFRSLPPSARADLKYLGPGMFLRLSLPSLIPAEVERLVYLDADTLCRSDLGPLFALPLDGWIVAAVRDAFTRTVASSAGLPGGESMPPGDPYFNSGVLVIDCLAWRRDEVEQRCLEYLAGLHDRLRFPDQDALNVVVGGRWLRLDRLWNHMMPWRLEPGHPRAETEPRARIVHFAGTWKPWLNLSQEGFWPDEYQRYARAAEFVR